MKDRVKGILKKYPLVMIPMVFYGKVFQGYRLYKKLVKKYGEDVKILRTAWHGTGDYYSCGLFLREYLKENKIENFIFLVPNAGSESKVTELFDIYKEHTQRISNPYGLTRFSEFMQQYYPLCKGFETSEQINFIGENLKGYKGLTLMDFYLHYGFGLSENVKRDRPQFNEGKEQVIRIFKDAGLLPGKTALIAPYSTCIMESELSANMWENIAKKLKNEGWSVATNCFGDEKPVAGTVALSVGYKDIVPFLDAAGKFVGVRSGLCEIISTSTCEKSVFYGESEFWARGNAKEFVDLENMGLSFGVKDLSEET